MSAKLFCSQHKNPLPEINSIKWAFDSIIIFIFSVILNSSFTVNEVSPLEFDMLPNEMFIIRTKHESTCWSDGYYLPEWNVSGIGHDGLINVQIMCECVCRLSFCERKFAASSDTRTQLGCVASIVGTLARFGTIAQFIFPFRLHITNINIINGFATWTERIFFI